MMSNRILVTILVFGFGVQIIFFSAMTREVTTDEIFTFGKSNYFQLTPAAVRATSKVYFPKPDTPEFEKTCPWISQQRQHGPNHPESNDRKSQCTLLVRPNPTVAEGLSRWICQVVFAFIIAKQADCRILLDYGEGVDIHKLLLSPPTPRPSSSLLNGNSNLSSSGNYKIASHQNQIVDYDNHYNWTVPKDFQCLRAKKCFFINGHDSADIPKNIGTKIALVPSYRYIYGRNKIDFSKFEELSKVLHGFDIQTGFACALGQLFHDLSPSILEYVHEPQLFTHILPTVRDSKSLVMALYIRTMHSENKTSIDKFTLEDSDVQHTIRCALQLEKQKVHQLMAAKTTIPHRVVWTVLTDSPQLKGAILNEYNGQQIILKDIHANVTSTSGTAPTSPLKRTVLVTQARGIHTRKREPSHPLSNRKAVTVNNISTNVFAEALVDWFLIGESDLVILNKWTFGITASLRTNRTIYDASTCSPKTIRSR